MYQTRKQKLAYGAVFIILIGFLVFAVLSSRDSKTSSRSDNTRIRESASDKDPSSSDASKPSDNPTTTTQPSTSDATTRPSSTTTNSGQQLVNAGPGQTVTLFMATVLAGTAIAHVHQRRVSLKH